MSLRQAIKRPSCLLNLLFATQVTLLTGGQVDRTPKFGHLHLVVVVGGFDDIHGISRNEIQDTVRQELTSRGISFVEHAENADIVFAVAVSVFPVVSSAEIVGYSFTAIATSVSKVSKLPAGKPWQDGEAGILLKKDLTGEIHRVIKKSLDKFISTSRIEPPVRK